MLAQEKLFVRAAGSVPIQLKDALFTAELLDPGLLKAYPRTTWAKLVTPCRKAELQHAMAATSATSSSVSQSIFPCFPSALNTAGGLTVVSISSGVGNISSCISVASSAVGSVEFSGSVVHANVSGPVQVEECSQSGDVESSVKADGCMRALMGSSGNEEGSMEVAPSK